MLQQFDNRTFDTQGVDQVEGRYEGDNSRSQDVQYPNVHIYPPYTQPSHQDTVPGFKHRRTRYINIVGLVVIAVLIMVAIFVTAVFASGNRHSSMHSSSPSTTFISTPTSPSSSQSSDTEPVTVAGEQTLATNVPVTTTSGTISSSSEGFGEGSSTISIAATSPIFQECGYRPTLAPVPQGRIIGGSPATDATWPWIGSLQNNDGHICGATLIDERFVITAAHCLNDESVDELAVVFGTNTINTSAPSPPETSVPIDQAFVDPSYDSDGHDHDFAVLKLQESVTYSQNLFPACLPPGDLTLREGTLCWIAGWGKTRSNGDYPPDLMEVQVPLISREDCEDYISGLGNPLTERMFCAGYEVGGIDSCKGDSGGPLVCQLEDSKWYLYGVISWGYGCALPRLPGIYAKVNEFYDLLRQWTDFGF